MRTETEIRNEIASAKLAYLEANNTLPSNQVIPFSKKVKELQAELSDFISSGANSCPDCKLPPHGMHVSAHFINGVTYHLYEIGCRACENHCARGASAAEAVKDWNNGIWFDRKEQKIKVREV
jgi:hypothetical protein